VYRSDDGGETWRATYFQDPRFKNYNVALDWETASCGQSFKGGETPFGVAICNSDPNRVILVRNEPHITHDGGVTWFGGRTYPAPAKCSFAPISSIQPGIPPLNMRPQSACSIGRTSLL
jgi:hypothetical protein